MSKISKSSNHNVNYLAKIVKINNIRPHTNADRLMCTTICNYNVIVGKDVKIGDVGVFFPIECQISPILLKANNEYSATGLNEDPTKKGYFDYKGRVKCQRLRGERSEGYFAPISFIEKVFPDLEYKIDDDFDTVDGQLICKKYYIERQYSNGTGEKRKRKDINDKLSHIINPRQFRFHIETPQINRARKDSIKEDDIISITYKEHGSSGISSNVLCNIQLGWWSKLKKRLGFNIPTEEYREIWSSGKPKSRLPKGVMGLYKNKNKDYYSSDIWYEAHKVLRDHIRKGLSIYYEIVGFTPNGAYIQKDYDYGCTTPEYNGDCEPYTYGKHFKIKIYRITSTSPEGVVTEFTNEQIRVWCENHGFDMVKTLYYGKAKDVLSKKDKDNKLDEFMDNLIHSIKSNPKFYLENDCILCKNKVPAEGVVIRIDSNLNEFDVYKLKSEKFNARETKQLNEGQIDSIEEE